MLAVELLGLYPEGQLPRPPPPLASTYSLKCQLPVLQHEYASRAEEGRRFSDGAPSFRIPAAADPYLLSLVRRAAGKGKVLRDEISRALA